MQTAIDSPKVAIGVSSVTMGAGWGSKLLNFIPHTPAEVAACIGGLLSLVLIYTNIQKYILETKNLRLSIKLKERRVRDAKLRD